MDLFALGPIIAYEGKSARTWFVLDNLLRHKIIRGAYYGPPFRRHELRVRNVSTMFGDHKRKSDVSAPGQDRIRQLSARGVILIDGRATAAIPPAAWRYWPRSFGPHP
jgi:hypothetical protein